VTRRFVLAACLLALGLSAARADDDQDEARRALETGQALPFDRILDRARREHPGQLLGVEIERHGGHLVYELRILAPGGQIGQWRYDARTGAPVAERHRPRDDD
jgi:uncharacterized membrane protein YkoI